jgi:hypothetical protein
VRGLGGFAVVKVSTLEGFQQGSMGGFRWGFDEGLQLKPRATRCVENRKLIAEGAAHYKGERRNPKPLVGLGTARQARGFRRVSEGFGGFGFILSDLGARPGHKVCTVLLGAPLESQNNVQSLLVIKLISPGCVELCGQILIFKKHTCKFCASRSAL